jgi:hypothetical protein
MILWTLQVLYRRFPSRHIVHSDGGAGRHVRVAVMPVVQNMYLLSLRWFTAVLFAPLYCIYRLVQARARP